MSNWNWINSPSSQTNYLSGGRIAPYVPVRPSFDRKTIVVINTCPSKTEEQMEVEKLASAILRMKLTPGAEIRITSKKVIAVPKTIWNQPKPLNTWNMNVPAQEHLSEEALIDFLSNLDNDHLIELGYATTPALNGMATWSNFRAMNEISDPYWAGIWHWRKHKIDWITVDNDVKIYRQPKNPAPEEVRFQDPTKEELQLIVSDGNGNKYLIRAAPEGVNLS